MKKELIKLGINLESPKLKDLILNKDFTDLRANLYEKSNVDNLLNQKENVLSVHNFKTIDGAKIFFPSSFAGDLWKKVDGIRFKNRYGYTESIKYPLIFGRKYCIRFSVFLPEYERPMAYWNLYTDFLAYITEDTVIYSDYQENRLAVNYNSYNPSERGVYSLPNLASTSFDILDIYELQTDTPESKKNGQSIK